jgi:DNA-binding transcriptional ArsR family regulator
MSRKSKPPVALYSALADVTRCRILEILKAAPTPVHVLSEAFSISRPAISRHLRVLKSAGLVAEVKNGRENVYTFKPGKLTAARTWLDAITGAAVPEDVEVAASPEPEVAPVVEEKLVFKPTKVAPKRAEKPITQESRQPKTEAPAAPTPINQMGFDF